MTPEEAIEELREASDSEVRYGDTERHYNEVMKRVEAFDMAIKALEEVSRLPENLHREREQAYMNGYADGKSTCRWISVDDKLPEEDQRVLVIYIPLISDTEKISIDFIKGKYWQNHGGVIAWMPLPEWEGMEYDEECKTMKIKKSAYDDAIERIDKSTFTLNDGLDCVETLVAMEAVMIASRQPQPCEDYISSTKLLEHLENITMDTNPDNYECKDKWYQANGFNACKVDIEMYVKKLLSVTPTRPTGKWIKYQEPWGGMQGWKCSNCKNHYDVSSVYTIIPYNYCPNCGAEMSGGREDESIREDKTI